MGTDPPEQALWNLGNLLSKRGDLPRAVDALHRAARLNPNNAALFQTLGDLYLQMGNLGAARDNYAIYVRLANRVDPAVLRYVEAGLLLQSVQRYAPSVLLLILLVYLAWTTSRDLWRRWRPARFRPSLSSRQPPSPCQSNRRSGRHRRCLPRRLATWFGLRCPCWAYWLGGWRAAAEPSRWAWVVV